MRISSVKIDITAQNDQRKIESQEERKEEQGFFTQQLERNRPV
jgi:hypothetical protein